MNQFSKEPEVKWSSFMPALAEALARSSGDVVEFGIGHFSTPFLSAYCNATNRKLFSIETNEEWFNEFKHLGSNGHHLFCGDAILLAGKIKTLETGLVFIDSSPGGEHRAALVKEFLPCSQYIVVHDYHRENEEAIAPLIKGRKFNVYKDYDPPTLIVKGDL
jgi:hypothetical protein